MKTLNTFSLIHLACLACALTVLTASAADDPRPLMKDFVGLNGHFQFKPELYKQVCRHVRNYHNINWDVKKPGDPITFPMCPNKVNWDTHVYGKWKRHGFETDLCAQFGSFGRENKDYATLWKGQDKWCYRYGFEMAKYFGPSGKQLVSSIEIGNEPGKGFDDGLYQRIFIQMAKGIRAADPAVKIVTATARANSADDYSKSLQETFSSAAIKPLYDVINLHTYAAKPKAPGRSPWDRSYPEDPTLDYLKNVDDTISWRDKNASGKEIWITEFGYDSCTPQAMKSRKGWFKKLNWTGVNDLQQAQYTVRSLFCFAERDVERAYIYFFNDKDEASVHAASGLTRNFVPKPSFWAVKHVYETLGDYRFSRVVSKDAGKVFVYEFAHGSKANRRIWVVWSPTGSGRSQEITLRNLPGAVASVNRMPTTKQPAKAVKWTGGTNTVSLVVSESPTYLIFK
ncbi:MAG: hypothetical protein QGG09_09175 [Pirellulaceae bacterium]|jgi:hypothetical protein|nr:hypothetical protein [Pirellulaceae bacterium]